jgi:hypothetical protein
MIVELIGTWLLVGFVSAIGWNVADETVNKPYLDPWIAKKINAKTDNDADEEPAPPVAKKQKTLPGSQNK